MLPNDPQRSDYVSFEEAWGAASDALDAADRYRPVGRRTVTLHVEVLRALLNELTWRRNLLDSVIEQKRKEREQTERGEA